MWYWFRCTVPRLHCSAACCFVLRWWPYCRSGLRDTTFVCACVFFLLFLWPCASLCRSKFPFCWKRRWIPSSSLLCKPDCFELRMKRWFDPAQCNVDFHALTTMQISVIFRSEVMWKRKKFRGWIWATLLKGDSPWWTKVV